MTSDGGPGQPPEQTSPEQVTPGDERSESSLANQLLARARAAAPGTDGSYTSGRGRRGKRRRARRPVEDGAYSGAGPDERDPQPVGSVVDDLVDERGWSKPLAVGGVEGRWAQIVGVDIAVHCAPEEFEAGRLVVRTDSTAWATQIRLLAPTLLARLNDDLGAGTVTHLQVVPPRGPSWRKGKLRVKGRGPRDTYG